MGNATFWSRLQAESWTDLANWSSGIIPPANENVVIDGPGNPTVTLTTNVSIQSLLIKGASLVLNGGTIRGGTVTTAGGAKMVVIGSGTLDGLTLNGDMDVGTSNSPANLTVTNGLVLNGTVQVGHPTLGSSAAISFGGTQTLDGTGRVVFGVSTCNALRLTGSGTTLTNGPGILVHGKNGQIGSHNACWGGPTNVGVVNLGTISADTSGRTITINAQPFINLGITNQLNGGILIIQ